MACLEQTQTFHVAGVIHVCLDANENIVMLVATVSVPQICSQIRVTLFYPGVLTPFLSISMAFSNLFSRVSSFLASVIQRQYSF